jgi:hypothetical protein
MRGRHKNSKMPILRSCDKVITRLQELCFYFLTLHNVVIPYLTPQSPEYSVIIPTDIIYILYYRKCLSELSGDSRSSTREEVT